WPPPILPMWTPPCWCIRGCWRTSWTTTTSSTWPMPRWPSLAWKACCRWPASTPTTASPTAKGTTWATTPTVRPSRPCTCCARRAWTGRWPPSRRRTGSGKPTSRRCAGSGPRAGAGSASLVAHGDRPGDQHGAIVGVPVAQLETAGLPGQGQGERALRKPRVGLQLLVGQHLAGAAIGSGIEQLDAVARAARALPAQAEAAAGGGAVGRFQGEGAAFDVDFALGQHGAVLAIPVAQQVAAGRDRHGHADLLLVVLRVGAQAAGVDGLAVAAGREQLYFVGDAAGVVPADADALGGRCALRRFQGVLRRLDQQRAEGGDAARATIPVFQPVFAGFGRGGHRGQVLAELRIGVQGLAIDDLRATGVGQADLVTAGAGAGPANGDGQGDRHPFRRFQADLGIDDGDGAGGQDAAVRAIVVAQLVVAGRGWRRQRDLTLRMALVVAQAAADQQAAVVAVVGRVEDLHFVGLGVGAVPGDGEA